MTKVVDIDGSRLANFLHFQRDPLGFLLKVQPLGAIVSLRSSRKQPSYVINHPEAIREILVTKDEYFRKGRSSSILRLTLGDSILTTEDQNHDRLRQIMLPAFHKQHIQGYPSIMAQKTAESIQHWQDDEIREIHLDMMKITLLVILKAMFDIDAEKQADSIARAVNEVIQFSAKRLYSPLQIPYALPTIGNIKHKKAIKVLDSVSYKALDQRKRQSQNAKQTLLNLLLEAKKQGLLTSDQEIRNQIVTMLIAGHETTANALTWVFYCLSQHPEVETKLTEEVDRVLQGRMPSYEDLLNLPFTKQVLQETLRLYPPAWMILREAKQTVNISGNSFSPGSIMMISPYTVHRNPQYFNQADQFLPERFTPDFLRDLPPFTYFPFGGGSRSCIGSQFALMEGTMILALVIQRFRLQWLDQTVLPEPSVSLRIKNGLKLRVQRR